MNKPLALATVLAAGHLILVACGASGLVPHPHDPSTTPPAKAVAWYGAMSGADNGYGFYAPGVGPETRAVFTLVDADGKSWTDTLERGTVSEVKIRVHNTVSMFQEDHLRPTLTRSWASTMFARHPTAVKVIIHVDVFDPPSMEDYRAGIRGEWETIYEGVSFRQ